MLTPCFFAAASSTRSPSGATSLPIPSPGMTAIRYCLFSLLIERDSLWSGRSGDMVWLIGLQWTKAGHGATLQCNVDRLSGGGLTVEIHRRPHQTSPPQESNPMDLHLRG